MVSWLQGALNSFDSRQTIVVTIHARLNCEEIKTCLPSLDSPIVPLIPFYLFIHLFRLFFFFIFILLFFFFYTPLNVEFSVNL